MSDARKSLCREIHARFGYTDEQRKALRRLLQYTILKVPEFGRWYLHNSNELTDRLIAAKADWSYIKGLNDAAVMLMEVGQKDAAVYFYAYFVMKLADQYMPEWCDNQDAMAGRIRLTALLEASK